MSTFINDLKEYIENSTANADIVIDKTFNKKIVDVTLDEAIDLVKGATSSILSVGTTANVYGGGAISAFDFSHAVPGGAYFVTMSQNAKVSKDIFLAGASNLTSTALASWNASAGTIYGGSNLGGNVTDSAITIIDGGKVNKIYAGGKNGSHVENSIITFSNQKGNKFAFSGIVSGMGYNAINDTVENSALVFDDFAGDFNGTVKSIDKLVISSGSNVNFIKAQDKTMKNSAYEFAIDETSLYKNNAMLNWNDKKASLNQIGISVNSNLISEQFNVILLSGNAVNQTNYNVKVTESDGSLLANYRYNFSVINKKLIFTYTGNDLALTESSGISSFNLSQADDTVNLIGNINYNLYARGGDDRVNVVANSNMNGDIVFGAGNANLSINSGASFSGEIRTDANTMLNLTLAGIIGNPQGGGVNNINDLKLGEGDNFVTLTSGGKVADVVFHGSDDDTFIYNGGQVDDVIFSNSATSKVFLAAPMTNMHGKFYLSGAGSVNVMTNMTINMNNFIFGSDLGNQLNFGDYLKISIESYDNIFSTADINIGKNTVVHINQDNKSYVGAYEGDIFFNQNSNYIFTETVQNSLLELRDSGVFNVKMKFAGNVSNSVIAAENAEYAAAKQTFALEFTDNANQVQTIGAAGKDTLTFNAQGGSITVENSNFDLGEGANELHFHYGEINFNSKVNFGSAANNTLKINNATVNFGGDGEVFSSVSRTFDPNDMRLLGKDGQNRNITLNLYDSTINISQNANVTVGRFYISGNCDISGAAGRLIIMDNAFHFNDNLILDGNTDWNDFEFIAGAANAELSVQGDVSIGGFNNSGFAEVKLLIASGHTLTVVPTHLNSRGDEISGIIRFHSESLTIDGENGATLNGVIVGNNSLILKNIELLGNLQVGANTITVYGNCQIEKLHGTTSSGTIFNYHDSTAGLSIKIIGLSDENGNIAKEHVIFAADTNAVNLGNAYSDISIQAANFFLHAGTISGAFTAATGSSGEKFGSAALTFAQGGKIEVESNFYGNAVATVGDLTFDSLNLYGSYDASNLSLPPIIGNGMLKVNGAGKLTAQIHGNANASFIGGSQTTDKVTVSDTWQGNSMEITGVEEIQLGSVNAANMATVTFNGTQNSTEQLFSVSGNAKNVDIKGVDANFRHKIVVNVAGNFNGSFNKVNQVEIGGNLTIDRNSNVKTYEVCHEDDSEFLGGYINLTNNDAVLTANAELNVATNINFISGTLIANSKVTANVTAHDLNLHGSSFLLGDVGLFGTLTLGTMYIPAGPDPIANPHKKGSNFIIDGKVLAADNASIKTYSSTDEDGHCQQNSKIEDGIFAAGVVNVQGNLGTTNLSTMTAQPGDTPYISTLNLTDGDLREVRVNNANLGGTVNIFSLQSTAGDLTILDNAQVVVSSGISMLNGDITVGASTVAGNLYAGGTGKGNVTLLSSIINNMINANAVDALNATVLGKINAATIHIGGVNNSFNNTLTGNVTIDGAEVISDLNVSGNVVIYDFSSVKKITATSTVIATDATTSNLEVVGSLTINGATTGTIKNTAVTIQNINNTVGKVTGKVNVSANASVGNLEATGLITVAAGAAMLNITSADGINLAAGVTAQSVVAGTTLTFNGSNSSKTIVTTAQAATYVFNVGTIAKNSVYNQGNMTASTSSIFDISSFMGNNILQSLVQGDSFTLLAGTSNLDNLRTSNIRAGLFNAAAGAAPGEFTLTDNRNNKFTLSDGGATNGNITLTLTHKV